MLAHLFACTLRRFGIVAFVAAAAAAYDVKRKRY